MDRIVLSVLQPTDNLVRAGTAVGSAFPGVGGKMCCCQASKWPLAVCDCQGLFWVLTGRRESYLINQQLMVCVCVCVYTYL